MSDVLTISVDARVATVTLNRPHKHNAIDLAMFSALGDAGEELKADRSVRAVVLTGSGENFCSGIDTSVFEQAGSAIDPSMMAPVASSPANVFQRAAYVWRELETPVICAVNGVAFGGGLQIALGADLRFASPGARFSIMEIEWGLIPDLALSATLRDIVPLDRVKELAWSGRIVAAEEALELGLVTAIHDDPLLAATETARGIAARSPDAIRGIKRLCNRAWRLSDAEALALEAEIQSRILRSPNQLEAIMARLERREPRFQD
jgi:enoyl-CoA hydratase/carnithine racemase